MKNGDYRTARAEYNTALEDPNEEMKQIATIAYKRLNWI